MVIYLGVSGNTLSETCSFISRVEQPLSSIPLTLTIRFTDHEFVGGRNGTDTEGSRDRCQREKPQPKRIGTRAGNPCHARRLRCVELFVVRTNGLQSDPRYQWRDCR